METRRLILFVTLSLAIFIGWTQFVVPRFMPPQPGRQQPVADEDNQPPDKDADEAPQGEKGENDNDNAQAATDGRPEQDGAGPALAEEADEPEARDKRPALAEHPHRAVVLGSLEPESGFFLEVRTTTAGAALDYARLNDQRYLQLPDPDAPNKPQQPLKVFGNDVERYRTLETSVESVDAQLKPFDRQLRRVDWKVESIDGKPPGQSKPPHSSVTYSFTSPDGALKLLKRYKLEKADAENPASETVRDTAASPYRLRFDFTIKNLGEAPQEARYVLQGPVGLPLENIEHTRTYRRIVAGFLEEGQKEVARHERSVDMDPMAADDVVEDVEEDTLEKWEKPFKFIGVDVQYFAALLIPEDDQLKAPYIGSSEPVLVKRAPDEDHSDISVRVLSKPLDLEPGGQITHSYSLYAGPKRDALLEPLAADGIIDYGWFSFISRGMLALLKFMHDTAYLPYGIAIIMLTIMVRGCMYPISRKQAAGAKKMKELQPQIAELKKKYGKDKEKFARAQMELFSKHNYNPLAGCLPILLQFPIFIGLYQALRNAVELRMAPFLWIENLAAPDALFRLPFELPFLGRDFNLLPLLTVVLFLAQQKMFMPPAADEQQAMQQKMMNFMMIFFGFLFYHVPAGLCVYFIASSLWGLAERKMLDYGAPGADAKKKSEAAKPEATTTAAKTKPTADSGRKGIWQRLLEAADEAAQASQSKSNGRSDGAGRDKKKKKTRKSRR